MMKKLDIFNGIFLSGGRSGNYSGGGFSAVLHSAVRRVRYEEKICIIQIMRI